jgi:hypothetical protein
MRQLPGPRLQHLDQIRPSQRSTIQAGQRRTQVRAWGHLGQTLREQLPHYHAVNPTNQV